MAFDPAAAARFIAEAHRARAPFRNLPEDIAPRTIDEAYAAQEALRALWTPLYGEVGGLKIATTTKVMQQLMGIDHPCGGVIYAKRIHASPAIIRLADYMHVVIECELAVRVGRTFEPRAAPYTREDVRAAVAEVMPAFELIEDRNADYKSSKATSLICDNAWNAGIVLGAPVKVAPSIELNGLTGRLATGSGLHTGKTDDPMGALAWIANLAASRGLPLAAGQVVITGSLIPTLPIAPGETFAFEIEGGGTVRATAA
jgi:2-oxo-3-hexenedioate decarboxylase/2-keto-4-pentenoate hydratase